MVRKPYDPDNDQDNEAGDDGLRMALSSLSIDFTKRELLALRSYINERLEDCADAGDGGVTVLLSSTDKDGARMDMVIPNATVFTEDDRRRLRDLEQTPTEVLGLVGMRELAALREREDAAKASEMRKQKATEARRRRIAELESFPCLWLKEADELGAMRKAEALEAAVVGEIKHQRGDCGSVGGRWVGDREWEGECSCGAGEPDGSADTHIQVSIDGSDEACAVIDRLSAKLDDVNNALVAVVRLIGQAAEAMNNLSIFTVGERGEADAEPKV